MVVRTPTNTTSRRRAGDVMSAPVVTAGPGTPFKELVQLLRAHRIGAVPVVGDDGRVIGVVSEADLILKRQLPPLVRPPVTALHNAYAKAEGWHAAELMSAPAVTVGPAADLAQVAELLHSRRIRHVPVVDGDGRLLGIVSINDLLDSYLIADTDLEQAIRRDVLDTRADLSGRTIRVRVTDGVVTLTGRVGDVGHARALVNAVATFDGVVGVVDQLTTGPARRAEAPPAFVQGAD